MAKGISSFKEELDNEIQNTSTYINSFIVSEVMVDTNLTTRITDLENDVGHQISIENPTGSNSAAACNRIKKILHCRTKRCGKGFSRYQT